jgi:5-methylcytosine-specific restriction endonuclease McrA
MRAYRRTHLADPDLARLLAERVAQDFATTAALLADLAEFDARELYLPAAHPSLLSYCTEVLHLSKNSALKRIQAARAAREFPMIFDAVAEGRIHLAGVCLLAPRLTPQNAEELLGAAEHKSKAEIEQLLAERFPRSEVLPLVQPLPPVSRADQAVANGDVGDGRSYAPGHTTPSVRAEVTPLSGRSFELRFSIQDHTHDKLRRAQELLSPAVAPGDLASLFDRALDCLIARAERQKFAATDRPSRTPRPTRSRRHIPAEVKRAVRERDAGRCTFVSETGERCPASHGLQFDHIEPVARGGMATVANVRLLCAAHNGYEAERIFGKGFIDEKRDRARNGAVVRPPDDPAGAPSASIHIAHEPPAQAQACAEAAEMLQEQELDVIAALRGLGVRAERARRVAEHCMTITATTFEERLRFAVQSLRPRGIDSNQGVHCG